MANDVIKYDALAREALRHVIRMVLEQTSRDGLPGEHHFFITFRTGAPGVELPDSLRADFPEEMTIVLQHQFSNLEVETEKFGVTLSFGGVPRHLVIPYSAVTAFFDPAVQFGLQFAPGADETADTPAAAAPAAGSDAEAKDEKADGKATGDVVQLDSFRKK